MAGKTKYQGKAGQCMMYAADLAAWAADLINGADMTALRAATHQQRHELVRN